MSHDLIFAARPAALAKAGLTRARVGREQNTYHPDGSVEFVFYSNRGNKKFIARVMVAANGNATVLESA